MRQRMIAEKGYTNHLASMYADKFTHLDSSVGGPLHQYRGPVVDLSREITSPLEKQMGTTMYPKNAGNLREHGQAVLCTCQTSMSSSSPMPRPSPMILVSWDLARTTRPSATNLLTACARNNTAIY